MKSLRNIILFSFAWALLATASPARAQQSDGELCQEQIKSIMAREHHFFRSVIFGLKKAEDAKVGEVRYDHADNTWYKAAENEWRCAESGFEATTWSDSMMDGQSQVPQRKGLLETKRMITSELVPYIGQSLRALQCRTDLLCDGVRQSIEQKGDSPVNITAHAHGCIDLDMQTLVSCHLARGNREEITERGDAELFCEQAGKQMLEQEAAIMELTVEYDSAYRSMLQLAGNFDLFLQEFRSPIVNSLRQMVNMVGSFNRIPCFLSSCDGSPPNDSL
ncbi:hypothetical protein COU79_04315 [Candidatus Peregrinibacteria bacterium CG10_big_fil_rev_8_21_14_0_10_54_7]|nr:MAG: hypothetical protein COU79_04315 [Candidatus Peregrinibacteria bacterium CG10_big_fil_rev_8_21_14_0_10_54_7]